MLDDDDDDHREPYYTLNLQKTKKEDSVASSAVSILNLKNRYDCLKHQFNRS